MSDITPISHHGAAAYLRAAGSRQAKSAATQSGVQRRSDSVELSIRSQYLAKLAALPPIREALVAQVRSEIQQGTYETTEKLDAAIEALIDDL